MREEGMDLFEILDHFLNPHGGILNHPPAPEPGAAHEAPPLAPAPAEVPHAPHHNLDPNPLEQEIGGESVFQIYSRLIFTYRGETSYLHLISYSRKLALS